MGKVPAHESAITGSSPTHYKNLTGYDLNPTDKTKIYIHLGSDSQIDIVSVFIQKKKKLFQIKKISMGNQNIYIKIGKCEISINKYTETAY